MPPPSRACKGAVSALLHGWKKGFPSQRGWAPVLGDTPKQGGQPPACWRGSTGTPLTRVPQHRHTLPLSSRRALGRAGFDCAIARSQNSRFSEYAWKFVNICHCENVPKWASGFLPSAAERRWLGGGEGIPTAKTGGTPNSPAVNLASE